MFHMLFSTFSTQKKPKLSPNLLGTVVSALVPFSRIDFLQALAPQFFGHAMFRANLRDYIQPLLLWG